MSAPRHSLDILEEEIHRLVDDADLLAHADENRRNSTGTFNGGRLAAFHEVLGLIENQRRESREIEDEHVPGRTYGPEN